MTIGILSCVWQRPERLDYTLGQLAKQGTNGWHLYLINNNLGLRELVDDTVSEYSLPMTVIHNPENHGPFARWELAHYLTDRHDYFLTLDDDAVFGPDLLSAWQDNLNGEVRGWRGFRFEGNYFEREKMAPGDECHYLWGSNLLVPAAVAGSPAILELHPRYWQADDLWVCFIANYLHKITLRQADIPISINKDGKDTWRSVRQEKIDLLEDLRNRGWRV